LVKFCTTEVDPSEIGRKSSLPSWIFGFGSLAQRIGLLLGQVYSSGLSGLTGLLDCRVFGCCRVGLAGRELGNHCRVGFAPFLGHGFSNLGSAHGFTLSVLHDWSEVGQGCTSLGVVRDTHTHTGQVGSRVTGRWRVGFLLWFCRPRLGITTGSWSKMVHSASPVFSASPPEDRLIWTVGSPSFSVWSPAHGSPDPFFSTSLLISRSQSVSEKEEKEKEIGRRKGIRVSRSQLSSPVCIFPQ